MSILFVLMRCPFRIGAHFGLSDHTDVGQSAAFWRPVVLYIANWGMPQCPIIVAECASASNVEEPF